MGLVVMLIRCAVRIARFYLVAVVVVASPSIAQEVSVLDLVNECDILAAHPDDPERYAEGVADDKIVPKLAIRACEKALENARDEPRFHFQLGRALLASHKEQDALVHFLKATEASYAAAWAYLGDVYQFGLGAEINAQKALEAYKKARDGGFEIAKNQVEQLQFDQTMYTGEFLALFFKRDFGGIDSKSNDSGIGNLARNYVFNLVLTLTGECNSVLKPTNVPSFYRYRYPQHWTVQSDENVAVAIQTSVAELDAQTFTKRHGCEGAVAKHVFSQMDAYFARFK